MFIKLFDKSTLFRRTMGILAAALIVTTLVVNGTGVVAVGWPGFEIDGNLQQNTSPVEDWMTVINGNSANDWSDGPGILIRDPLSSSGTDNTVFSTGSKFGDPTNWDISNKNVGTSQGELTNVYCYALTPAQSGGDAWLIMGMERLKKQGTFQMDFELNQVPWEDTSTGPVRTEGDIVVCFELSGNPTDAQTDLFIMILRYDPESTGSNTTTTEPYIRNYGAGFWVVAEGNGNDLRDGSGEILPSADATMNDIGIPVGLWGSYDTKGVLHTESTFTIGAFLFAEASINLTELGVNPDCPGFGTVHAKTRSSLEVTADLKDLAGPVTLETDCYIFGYKYNDLNGNGVKDESEPGLSGWTINLTGTAGTTSVSKSFTTNSSGYYEFRNLWTGSYQVAETNKTGWTQSYPPSQGSHQNIPVDISHTEQGPYIFLNYNTASKSGTKFNDLDADGVKDAAEPGLSGWDIYVDYDDDGVKDVGEPSATTAADGTYTIIGINPGTWKVKEVPQEGWTQSYPSSGYHEETFTSGASSTDNDFGNYQWATISGHKYEDMDGDGNLSEDTGNPLEGWLIKAYLDANGNGTLDSGETTIADSDTTDADGAYSLTLNPGKYIIVEVPVTNWFQSYPTNDVVTDSGENVEQGGYAITLESGDTETGKDFGNYREADLGIAKAGVISYTITVTNYGPGTALNAEIDDSLPGDLFWEIVSIRLDDGAPINEVDYATNGITVVWDTNHHNLKVTIASLEKDQKVEIVVEATIEGDAEHPLLENTATVDSDTPDPSNEDPPSGEPNSADADIPELPGPG